MADVSDVRNALVTLIASTLYPSTATGNSIAGYPVRVYAGWPKATALDLDMAGLTLVNGAQTANGVGPIVNISVFPRPSVERNTTRYQREWMTQTGPVATVTASVSGYVVTLGGTVTAGNYVSIIASGKAVSYALTSSDTLTTAAAALASLATAQWGSSTSSGAAITFPATLGGLITARVGYPVGVLQEVKRQQRSFQITVWAPNDAMRNAVASVIDPVLANTDFITLPDQTSAWLLYQGQNDSDVDENETVYRRDLFYWAEYATTVAQTSAITTVSALEIEGDGPGTPDYSDPPSAFTPTITIES